MLTVGPLCAKSTLRRHRHNKLLRQAGFAACAYVDPATAEKLGEACVIFSGVSTCADFLTSDVKNVNARAAALGIVVGMPGGEALEKLAR